MVVFLLFDSHSISPTRTGNDDILVGASDGKLYCVNKNGQLKWRFDTNAGIVGTVLVTRDGRVIVPSRDGYVYFLNSNGGLLYKYNFGDEVRGSPAELRDGTVVCGSLAGTLVAINPNNTVRWTFDSKAPISSMVRCSAPQMLIIVFICLKLPCSRLSPILLLSSRPEKLTSTAAARSRLEWTETCDGMDKQDEGRMGAKKKNKDGEETHFLVTRFFLSSEYYTFSGLIFAFFSYFFEVLQHVDGLH